MPVTGELKTSFHFFSLLRYLREDEATLADLQMAGLKLDEAKALLDQSLSAGEAEGADWGDMIQVSQYEKATFFWNDLEKDRKYAQYPSSLTIFLQPSWSPLRPISKNVFAATFVLRLSQKVDQMILFETLELVQRGVPLRIGLLPRLDDSRDTLLAALLFYLSDGYGKAKTIAFLQQVLFASPSLFRNIDHSIINKIRSRWSGMRRSG